VLEQPPREAVDAPSIPVDEGFKARLAGALGSPKRGELIPWIEPCWSPAESGKVRLCFSLCSNHQRRCAELLPRSWNPQGPFPTSLPVPVRSSRSWVRAS